MAANYKQFGTRIDPPSKHINEVNISSLDQKIASLTSLVRQTAVGNMQTVKACGICSVVGHPTNMCPTLQEEPIEHVNAVGGYPRQPQRKYDPCSSTYNPGWRDHPNLSYGNPQANQLVTQNHPSCQQYKQPYLPRQQAGQTSNSVPPFPQALVESRKDEQNKDLYETFYSIKQGKLKLKGSEKVRVRENVSKIIQRKLPAKCKDPGMFTIPCTIGNTQLEKAMLDLGASIIVMPYSIYASLKLGPLNKTGVVIQLADISIAYPKGIVEDVLVQVNDLVFPADFYVLDMENGDQTTPILLARPFLKTSKTKIDVHSGILTMQFDGEIEVDGLEVAISKHVEKENEELALNTDL
ncbi:hypothetical protein ACB092_11G227100 [Castanea dentata]